MTFRLKLITMMIALGTVIIVIFTSFMAVYNRRLLIASTLEANGNIAAAIAIHIDNYLDELAGTTKTLATAPLIRRSVLESNKQYGLLSEEGREKQLADFEELWALGNSGLLKTYLVNPVSAYLQSQKEVIPDLYGEIFLTNKYGALVATTNILTTFSHDYKSWWQASYNQGQGQVFFDDRGYDASVQDFVLGVTVPVYENGEVLGILKSNMKIQSLFSRILANYLPLFAPGTAQIARSGGRVVYAADQEPLAGTVGQAILPFLASEGGFGMFTDDLGREMLVNASPIQNTAQSAEYSFGGGQAKSPDHSGGNLGESWQVVLLFPRAVIDARVFAQTKQFWLVGLLSLALLSSFTLFFVQKATKNIMALVHLTTEVGQGNLEQSLAVPSQDEIGKLVVSFNQMLANLRESMASKAELSAEIEKRRQVERDLRYQSTVDELTRIYNRRAFNNHASKLITAAQKQNSPLAIALIDIDHFKIINDTHGHKMGDQVLISFSELLLQARGPEDILSRWGGDEFMVLMPRTSKEEALQAMEKLRRLVEDTKLAGDLQVTASIGVTSLQKGEAFDQLMTRVDDAQYQAKSLGRNNVQML